jgi:tetratricopeptide (TPR) repeat protein
LIPSRASILAVALLAGALAPAAAHADDRAAARGHFAQAERHYQVFRWSEALAAYDAAYQASPLPEFLYNMAQCHRQLGHAAEAVELYERFLAERPDAPNRAVVEGLIADLRPETAAAPTPPSPVASPTPVEEPAPAHDGPPAVEAGTQGAPLSRIRLPTWLALGGGVLMFGIGGLFALDASAAESDLASPSLDCRARLARCLDLKDRGDQSAALRNTFVLIGFAGLAGTAVLAVLDLTRGPSEDRVAWLVPVVTPTEVALTGGLRWQ